jgi:hypothetical protein
MNHEAGKIMSKQQLLIETVTAGEGNIITEASKNDGKTYLNGVFMQAEIENRNGRVYSLSEMTENVEAIRKQINEFGGVFGELDHPDTITINMDRISHAIKDLYMDGNNVVGKAQLLDTPMGLIAQELSKSGVRYGVSSRGAGVVSESGSVSGFNLVTIDLVVTPSAPGAMPTTVMEAMEGTKLMSLAESVKHDDSAQKYFKSEILKIVENILNK